MSVDRPSSSTIGISSAEAKPTVSSANGHPSSSMFGTPTGAANPKQNTEVEKATSSLCCIPINTTTATPPAAPESKNLALQLVNEIGEDIVQVQKANDYLKDYRTRVSKQNEEASKMLEKKIEVPLENKIKEAFNAFNSVKSLADSLIPSDDRRAEGPTETDVQEDSIELKKNVKNIRLQILSELKPLISTSKSHPHGNYRTDDSTHKRRKSKNLDKKVPNLYKNEMLARSSEFKDFKEFYDGLGSKQKLCLLCFSVFPEKEIIKKRFMFYWWTAEGFVAPVKGSEQTAEVLANEVFSELMAKRFIEPFYEKRILAGLVNKCHMHPFVRAAVITLARRAKFYDFDAEGNLYPKKDAEGKPIGNFSSCLVCLLAGEEMLTQSVTSMSNVHMLFNVNESVLNFEKPELFSEMKNINLLCLGRWQTSQTHHIEVEDTKFLEGLKNMKYLKFLSLQGISLIKDLPTSVSNLTNLTMLDIKACPNLETIPGEIGLLKCLTHLDMSECYLLVNMPKEISKLVQLEVLKGFVVGGESEGKDQKDSCTLGHLVGLTKLRKLSIFTGVKSFPSDSELRDLNQLKKLLTLSIEWGRDVRGKSENNPNERNITEVTPPVGPAEQQNSGGVNTENLATGINISESNNADKEADSRAIPSTPKRCNCLTPAVPANCFRLRTTSKTDIDASPKLPNQLEKLELQLKKLDLKSFPHLDAPKWLMDSRMNQLEKLYIRGGVLRDLGQYGSQRKKEWTVQILRLKFLHHLEMDWRDVLKLFPNLIYLEKVRCPKLTFFPCDRQGVWMKNQQN